MQNRSEIECHILGALCQGVGSEEATRALAGYRWQEPLHEAVFAVLTELPSSNPDVVRDQLPARLTRKGFPDVDLDCFLQPSRLERQEVERLVRVLQESQ